MSTELSKAEIDSINSRVESKREDIDFDVTVRVCTSLINGDFTVPLHNFDGDTKNKWRLTSLVTGSGAGSADSLGSDLMPVKYWYAHRIELTSERDGEIINATRIALVSPDEKVVAFVSDGIAKGLATLVQFNGIGPYDPALPVKVQAGQTRNKRRILNLIPA